MEIQIGISLSNTLCLLRKFAMNLKIPFHTPEEYFLGDKPAPFIMGAFNPLDYILPPPVDSISTSSVPTVSLIKPSAEPDAVLFVGSPASGKSTFYREHLASLGYARINQDTLKTRDRCVVEATELLTTDTSIVIGMPESTKTNSR